MAEVHKAFAELLCRCGDSGELFRVFVSCFGVIVIGHGFWNRLGIGALQP